MKTTATQSHSPEKNRILRIRISDNGTTVPFGEKDVEMFDRLFRIVDSNDDGVIEGALGAAFLRRSKLSDETLREVWRLACGGKSRPSMTREAWFLAMKMVAMAQQSDLGECPSLEDLAGESVLYTATPNFGFGIEHVVEKTNENRISPDDARIRVQNPSTQSSAMGIRGHTMYEIFTKTTLKHFVFKQMRVRRRFKEFEWLRRRLSRRYIGLVIPKLPAKRLYGNMDPHFIEERRMELQLFLNYILRHPLMNACLELEIFLTASRKGIQDAQIVAPNSDTIVKSVTENAWNSIKNVFGTSSSSSSKSYSSVLNQIPESQDFHRVRDAAREICSVSKPLRRVIAATENWMKIERSIHVASTRYAQLCLTISQEKSCSHTKCHANLARGLIEAAKHSHQLPNITAALVLTPCRFFEGLAEESCDIEKNRELLVQDYMDALDAKKVAQDFQSSGRLTLTPEEAKKADKRSEEADRLVKNSEERLGDLARSMLSEIKQIRSSKSSGMLRSIKRFVELQAEIASKQRGSWEDVYNNLKSSSLDNATATTTTSTSFSAEQKKSSLSGCDHDKDNNTTNNKEVAV